MNIVDSSGWLSYFADEPNAKYFLAPLHDEASLVVPTVTIYEVFKVVLENLIRMMLCRRLLPCRKEGLLICQSLWRWPLQS
jgi:uncharacterized protein with PIN domain